MKKKDGGFTLIELLIVIVILGILATVTVFAVRGITRSAEENTCEIERATVQTAVEAYYARNQAYPTGDIAAVLGTLQSQQYIREAPENAALLGLGGDFSTNGTVTANCVTT